MVRGACYDVFTKVM